MGEIFNILLGCTEYQGFDTNLAPYTFPDGTTVEVKGKNVVISNESGESTNVPLAKFIPDDDGEFVIISGKGRFKIKDSRFDPRKCIKQIGKYNDGSIGKIYTPLKPTGEEKPIKFVVTMDDPVQKTGVHIEYEGKYTLKDLGSNRYRFTLIDVSQNNKNNNVPAKLWGSITVKIKGSQLDLESIQFKSDGQLVGYNENKPELTKIKAADPLKDYTETKKIIEQLRKERPGKVDLAEEYALRMIERKKEDSWIAGQIKTLPSFGMAKTPEPKPVDPLKDYPLTSKVIEQLRKVRPHKANLATKYALNMIKREHDDSWISNQIKTLPSFGMAKTPEPKPVDPLKDYPLTSKVIEQLRKVRPHKADLATKYALNMIKQEHDDSWISNKIKTLPSFGMAKTPESKPYKESKSFKDAAVNTGLSILGNYNGPHKVKYRGTEITAITVSAPLLGSGDDKILPTFIQHFFNAANHEAKKTRGKDILVIYPPSKQKRSFAECAEKYVEDEDVKILDGEKIPSTYMGDQTAHLKDMHDEKTVTFVLAPESFKNIIDKQSTTDDTTGEKKWIHTDQLHYLVAKSEGLTQPIVVNKTSTYEGVPKEFTLANTLFQKASSLIKDHKFSEATAKLKEMDDEISNRAGDLNSDRYTLDLLAAYHKFWDGELQREIKATKKQIKETKEQFQTAIKNKELPAAEALFESWKDLKTTIDEKFDPEKSKEAEGMMAKLKKIKPKIPPSKIAKGQIDAIGDAIKITDVEKPIPINDEIFKLKSGFSFKGKMIFQYNPIKLDRKNSSAIIQRIHEDKGWHYLIVFNNQNETKKYLPIINKAVNTAPIIKKEKKELASRLLVESNKIAPKGEAQIISLNKADKLSKTDRLELYAQIKYKNMAKEVKKEMSEERPLFAIKDDEVKEIGKTHSINVLEPVLNYGSQFITFSIDPLSEEKMSEKLDGFILDLMKIVGQAPPERAKEIYLLISTKENDSKAQKRVGNLQKQLDSERNQAMNNIAYKCPEGWSKQKCMAAQTGGKNEDHLLPETGTCEIVLTTHSCGNQFMPIKSSDGMIYDPSERLYVIITSADLDTNNLLNLLEKAHVARYYLK